MGGFHGPFQPESMDYSMWIPDGVAHGFYMELRWNSQYLRYIDKSILTASTGN
jgi:hypothetical protein